MQIWKQSISGCEIIFSIISKNYRFRLRVDGWGQIIDIYTHRMSHKSGAIGELGYLAKYGKM
jgi:hypothetical protein